MTIPLRSHSSAEGVADQMDAMGRCRTKAGNARHSDRVESGNDLPLSPTSNPTIAGSNPAGGAKDQLRHHILL